MRLASLLRLLRFPNLFIVALTQYFLYALLLIPFFYKEDIHLSLDLPHFSLLVLATVLLTASGNIINDIFDQDIDQINKPEKVIVGKMISEQDAYRLYFFIFVLGMGIAIYLANHVGQLQLALIFPAAYALLYLYSARLKQSFLMGNLLVSLFCAGVAGIVWFAERKAHAGLAQKNEALASYQAEIFMAYILFAFLSTLFRELVKDIEDIRGDRQFELRTLPAIVGIHRAKHTALFMAALLLTSLFYWLSFRWHANNSVELLYLGLCIIVPVIIAMHLLYKSKEKVDFHRVSQLAKYIMLSGILYLLFL